MKKRCLNRKGYFFLIDSMLALGVLAIGLFLIFAVYIKSPSKQEVTILSDDIMDFFASNRIKDVNNDYAGLGGTLWDDPCIDFEPNPENTLLQQVAEFYEKSAGDTCYLDLAEQFIIELTTNRLPPQYIFEFRIHDGSGSVTLIYPQSPTQEHLDSKSATKVLIPSKKIVYGFSNIETGDMFGPYSAEVLVWQKST